MTHVSLKDIAAEAGVSFQTVSKVLKGKGSVSPETRAWILEVAERLGYVPNALARSLVSQRTATIGIVATDFSDYVLSQFVVGAEREARRQGQCVIVGSLDQDGSDAERYLLLLMERRVDGILLAAPQLEQNTRVGGMLNGLPVVSLHHVPGAKLRTVGSHQSQTGFLATQHLLELGHRRIGTIIGSLDRRVTHSRLRGYQRALQTMGVAYDPALVEEGHWLVEGGYEAAQRLLDRVPDITALFVQSDTMAIGVLSALHERGLRVPQDCAVVGCDDIPMAAHTIPPLTTIHIPVYETGEAAVRLLLDIIENRAAEEPQHISPPVHLVRRASSGGNEERSRLNSSATEKESICGEDQDRPGA
ncbi:MAG TPA: LacI family DNA-binding transcriptional regulator [Ktedonobacteraceae bacterium]|jgi:LacI family transcriptional regulator|nr:LacI family DNA-binding transcriptional regulator [Ktedonobacteraceae bacterium]